MEPAPAEEESLPRKGRLAGIDYGTKRVGIAVSDIYQEYSSPLQTYQRCGGQADCRFFTELVQEYRVGGFVVGLTVHMSGDESQKSKCKLQEWGRGRSLNTLLRQGFGGQVEHRTSNSK